MFGRSNFSILKINSSEVDLFRETLQSFGKDSDLNLTSIEEVIRLEGGSGVALSSFDYPLGDISDTLSNCEIRDGLFALWFTLLKEIPNQDKNVLKEHLSYENFTKPSKFLDKEQKEELTTLISQEPRAIERLAAPILVDFQRGLLWVNSTSKPLLEELRQFLDFLKIGNFSLGLDFGRATWAQELLDKLQKGEVYRDDFQERAREVRSAGHPNMVTPNEVPLKEKILKKFYSCDEHDGYHLFLGPPAKIHLGNIVSSVGVATPWDATDLLNHGGVVSQTRLIVAELEKSFNSMMSIDLGHSFSIDPGYLLLKGLEGFDLKRDLSDTNSAQGRLKISDYWAVAHASNTTCLFRFIDLVKEYLGLEHGTLKQLDSEEA
jgi:hypothetical protein